MSSIIFLKSLTFTGKTPEVIVGIIFVSAMLALLLETIEFLIDKKTKTCYNKFKKSCQEVAAMKLMTKHWSVLPPIQRHNTQHKASIRRRIDRR